MSARRQGGAKPLSELIAAYLKRSQVGRQVTREQLARAWCRAVGPEIAEATEVAGLVRGALEVEVCEAALLQELSTFYKAELLEALRAEIGPAAPPIRSLRFRLGAGRRSGRRRRGLET